MEGEGVVVAEAVAAEAEWETEDLRCPLTSRVMRDPVLLHTEAGRSYERAALEERLRADPYVDPSTGKRSPEKLVFTSNAALKKMLDNNRGPKRARDEPATPEEDLPLEPPDKENIFSSDRGVWLAVRQLRTARDSETRVNAARGVAVRCVSSASVRETYDPSLRERVIPESVRAVVRYGAVDPLVAMVRRQRGLETEAAALALSRIAMWHESAGSIVAAGAIGPLVRVLEGHATDLAKANAARALAELAGTDDNKVWIGAAGAIPPLIVLLEHGSAVAKERALVAIARLSSYPDNKPHLADAIPLLRDLGMEASSWDQKTRARRALRNLGHPLPTSCSELGWQILWS